MENNSMNKEKETKLIQPESFVTIQGWMVTHLKLKSNELMIYAIIYGFCQIRGQVFSGSVRYLAEWTNSTKRGVYKNLKSLVDKGLIEKIEENINGVKFCKYTICENRLPSRTGFCSPVMNKVHQGDEQSSPGGDEQSSPNNIDIDNIDNNIDIKKESIKERKKEKSQCIPNPPTGNEIQGASVSQTEGVAFGYTNALSADNKNALSSNNLKKESKKEIEKEFTRDEEEVSPPPSDGNSSDNYQKLSNQKKVLYNSDQNSYFVEFDSLGKQSNNNSDDSLIADESKKERKKVPAKKKEKPKREITKTFDDILDCYTSNHDIKDALVEFIKMRQRIRRPLTNRALTLNLEKLNDLAPNDEKKLEIIQQTIMNSWQSFYGINDFGKFKKKSPSYDLEKYKEESNQIKKDYGDSYTMTIGWGDD